MSNIVLYSGRCLPDNVALLFNRIFGIITIADWDAHPSRGRFAVTHTDREGENHQKSGFMLCGHAVSAAEQLW